MRISELRSLPGSELDSKIVSLRGDFSKAKTATASGTRSENPGIFRSTRREIARILTILNERRLGIKREAKKEKKKETKEIKKEKIEEKPEKKEEKKIVPPKSGISMPSRHSGLDGEALSRQRKEPRLFGLEDRNPQEIKAGKIVEKKTATGKDEPMFVYKATKQTDIIQPIKKKKEEKPKAKPTISTDTTEIIYPKKKKEER